MGLARRSAVLRGDVSRSSTGQVPCPLAGPRLPRAIGERDRSVGCGARVNAPGLHEIIERVHDRETLLDFVDALIVDREAAVAAEEENSTPFLGAVPDRGGW